MNFNTAEQSVTKNQLAGVDYWTEDNQGAYFLRPGTGDEQKTVYPSLRVRDGSFIKIKNITLGYTLPVKDVYKRQMKPNIILMNFTHVYEQERFINDIHFQWIDCTDLNGTNCYCCLLYTSITLQPT